MRQKVNHSANEPGLLSVERSGAPGTYAHQIELGVSVLLKGLG